MRKPEEIKRGLECCMDTRCKGCPYASVRHCAQENGLDALAYIQQLELEVADLRQDPFWACDTCVHAGSDTPSSQHWISVEERLPEEDVRVLVYAKGKKGNAVTEITYYSSHLYGFNITGWQSPSNYFYQEHTITHWMPLPEPPEEENE